MQAFRNSTCSGLLRFLMIAWLPVFISSCAFNITRYTDGPLTQYLSEPIPKLKQPIAKTLSLEKVMFQTAASFKATMISDMVAREIYFMPADVGHEVKSILNMDKEYSENATYQALNLIAKNRAQARHMWSGDTGQLVTTTNSAGQSTQAYIQRQDSMAKAAYKKGDYLGGNIHTSASMNAMKIQQSYERAQATVGFTFAVFNAFSAFGEALIKSDFIELRNWIEFESGAISDNDCFARVMAT